MSSHEGTLLAVEELNAAGGVLGKKLELVYEDNRSTPGESLTIAKKLINSDKVIAILGEVASGRSLEVAPFAQSSRIPQISPSSTNPDVTKIGDYIFRVCFIDPFQGKLLAGFAKNTLKAQKVALFSDVAAPYSVGLAKFFKEAWLAGGGELVSEVKYTVATRTSRHSSRSSRTQSRMPSWCLATTPMSASSSRRRGSWVSRCRCSAAMAGRRPS